MLNLQVIAGLLANKFGGQGVLDQAVKMMQSGNGPDAIMNMLEQQNPNVKDNEIWKNLKGKSGPEIEQYAANLIKSLGVFK